MIRIPVLQAASSDFTERIELGGQIVQLRVTWNTREACFYLSLTDPFGATLDGIKVVPEWPLLKQFLGSVQFDGELMVLQTTRDVAPEITYENFGAGWDLLYLTTAEREVWENNRGI